MQDKGIITQAELAKRIRDHERWLKDPSTGKRFQESRTDFIGMDFEGNLSNAIMDNCDLSFTTWNDVRIDGATLDKCNFSNSNIINLQAAPGRATKISDCNFQSSEIQNTQINDARLEKINFYQSNLKNVTFRNCSSMALSFESADWNFGGFVNGQVDGINCIRTEFSDVGIWGCTVFKMNAPSFDFSKMKSLAGTSLLDCNFTDALAKKVSFGSGANDPLGLVSVAVSNFVGADLSGCYFNGLEVHRCNFSDANMSGATFNDVDLTDCNFRRVVATNFTITGCYAYKVAFVGSSGGNWFLSNCELSRADFSNTSIVQSKLEWSDLTGANFFNADISTLAFVGSDLDGAVWVAGERCKAGSKGMCLL